MRNRKKHLRALSTSDIYTKRLKNRTTLAGGVTVDRSVAIDRIRNSSLGLGQNILKPTESNCSFVYSPSSYGEGKNFDVYPNTSGSDFDFTRATTRTVTNKDGSIGDSCYNLLKYSEDYSNAAWVKSNITQTPNASINPIGGTNATKIVPASGVSSKAISQGITIKNGTTFTATIYAKAAEWKTLFIYYNDNASRGIWVDLTTGVITGVGVTSTDIKIQPNGYYKCSFTSTALTDVPSIIIGCNNINSIDISQGDGTSGIYIWGSQLTQGTLLDYLKTTNRFAVPGIDYSLDLTKPSLLIEPQRTNIILDSQNFNSSNWQKEITASFSFNAAVSPDGSNNANKVYANSNTSSSFIRFRPLTSTISAVSGTTYSHSFYAKNAGLNYIMMRVTTIAADIGFTVNLTTGAITQGYYDGTVASTFPTSYSAKLLPNGWVYITYTFTATATTTGNLWHYLSNTVNDTTVVNNINNGVYIWGEQFEAGSNSTSYIPTTSVTVTRNGETSFVDLQNNALLNQNNFTLFVEGYNYSNDPSNVNIFLSDAPTSNTVSNLVGIYNSASPIYQISGVTTGLNNVTLGYYKFAIQRSGTSVKFFKNGVQIWTTQTIPVFDYRYLVVRSGDPNGVYAINKIELYKETLSDAQLITKTT